MTPRRFLVLGEPGARTGGRALRALTEALPPGSFDRSIGGAPDRVAAYERVFVAGGDGTVRRFVPALARAARVALVPAGTGNNLARALGVPLDLGESIRLAITGQSIRRVDIMEISGARRRLHAATMAALGFGAKVALDFAVLRGTPPGRFLCSALGERAYRVLSLYEVVVGRFPGHPVVVSMPGTRLRFAAAALFVGSTGGIGGRFRPCPGAEPDDGALHLCVFARPRMRSAAVALLREVSRGSHVRAGPPPRLGEGSLEVPTARPDLVRVFRTRGPIELTFLGDPPRSGLLADGDLLPPEPRLTFSVRPRCLPIVVPG